jgi:CDP-ribitol ribitolphosphotransferase
MNEAFISGLRETFEKEYPQLVGKKLVLYAPSFRENPTNNAVFDYFEIEKFIEELGDDYALAIRLHPNYASYCDEEHPIDLKDLRDKYDIIDFTGFKDEQKLLLLSDIFITDYSSIMVDYTILKKPILLFAYDLDDYLKNERGFYFDYRQKVPGKIVYDIDELIESIKDEDFHMEKLEEFSQFQFGDFKANASKSILDYILED